MDENEQLQSGETILQILSSIRSLDGRIDEIKRGVTNEYYSAEGKRLMKLRMGRLINTRMQLICSLLDERIFFNRYLGEATRITYENLKREIGQ